MRVVKLFLTYFRSDWRAVEPIDKELVSPICRQRLAVNWYLVMSTMSTGHTPEARVLIVMTGGTICMQKSPNGLVPARNFLERCMAPRPEFNDGETHDPIEVRFHDGPDGMGELHSLRTPTSVYGKRVRYVALFGSLMQAFKQTIIPVVDMPRTGYENC